MDTYSHMSPPLLKLGVATIFRVAVVPWLEDPLSIPFIRDFISVDIDLDLVARLPGQMPLNIRGEEIDVGYQWICNGPKYGRIRNMRRRFNPAGMPTVSVMRHFILDWPFEHMFLQKQSHPEHIRAFRREAAVMRRIRESGSHVCLLSQFPPVFPSLIHRLSLSTSISPAYLTLNS